MSNKKKRPLLSINTYNLLSQNDREYHWSRAYLWYVDQHLEERMQNKIWSTALANVGCMPKVFHALDLVSWCSKKFELGTHIIHLSGASEISVMFTHHIFNKIINFPKGAKELNLPKANSYLSNNGATRLLSQFIKDPAIVKCNQIHFDLKILKESYRDFIYLSLHVVGRESTSTFPWYVIYVLYMTFCKYIFFYWGQIILS
jgi:hypothetical protein